MSTRPGSPDPDLKQKSGSERTRRFVLAATVIGSAMAFIDGTIVTIALPVIQRELSAAFQDLQWVVNGYTLMLGALILVGGALGDRMGRRRIFVHGLGIFAVASLFCAVAANVHVLIAARVLQGFGAALLVPQSLAIIAATFPRDVRGRAIGAWAAASAIAAALGPPLGGLLIDTLTWRAAFLINLPLSGAALWLTFAHVPESRDETASGPVDWLGAALAVTALGALTYGLTLVSEGADRIMVIAAAIAAGVIGLGAFWRVEKHATNPMLPAGLFRSRPFLVTNIITLLLYGALGGVLFLLPFDLIARRGMAASAVGTVLLPLVSSSGFCPDRPGASPTATARRTSSSAARSWSPWQARRWRSTSRTSGSASLRRSC